VDCDCQCELLGMFGKVLFFHGVRKPSKSQDSQPEEKRRGIDDNQSPVIAALCERLSVSGVGACGQARKRAAPLCSALTVTAPVSVAGGEEVGTKGVLARLAGTEVSGLAALSLFAASRWE
jgi:hypothetical protein